MSPAAADWQSGTLPLAAVGAERHGQCSPLCVRGSPGGGKISGGGGGGGKLPAGALGMGNGVDRFHRFAGVVLVILFSALGSVIFVQTAVF